MNNDCPETKTPIPGTPIDLIPGLDFYIRDQGIGAYQTEPFQLAFEGLSGRLDIKLQEGKVDVVAYFGVDSWGETIGHPITYDGVRYSAFVSAPSIELAEFEIPLVARSLTVSMSNLDHQNFCGLFPYPTQVGENEEAVRLHKDVLVNGVSTFLEKLEERYPSFGTRFRAAVAEMEIERLRGIQEAAWVEMEDRAVEIRRYMDYSDSAARLEPEQASSDNVASKCEAEPVVLSIGMARKVEIVNRGDTFAVRTFFLDGTVREELLCK